ncbi:hypothetical protein HK100_008913 [Physocladia obscura]|uniref:Uncharacterized protein n=1 Tax=Physocladia obscura TaxID=109957 RepID=A0AAD5T4B7_9FUNG|nr:hypothetical protein HK100_008913 [Physocladia obscura]
MTALDVRRLMDNSSLGYSSSLDGLLHSDRHPCTSNVEGAIACLDSVLSEIHSAPSAINSLKGTLEAQVKTALSAKKCLNGALNGALVKKTSETEFFVAWMNIHMISWSFFCDGDDVWFAMERRSVVSYSQFNTVEATQNSITSGFFSGGAVLATMMFATNPVGLAVAIAATAGTGLTTAAISYAGEIKAAQNAAKTLDSHKEMFLVRRLIDDKELLVGSKRQPDLTNSDTNFLFTVGFICQSAHMLGHQPKTGPSAEAHGLSEHHYKQPAISKERSSLGNANLTIIKKF